MSERRRRQGQQHGESSTAHVNDEAPEHASPTHDDDNRAEGYEEDPTAVEADDVLREPFPGGPTDVSLLSSFLTHVAAKIWYGEEREVLRCFCHTSKLREWSFERDESTRRFRRFIRNSKINNLCEMAYFKPNRNLVSAFIERWHPETNTFHMPFGEMSITLDDVFCLTGLPVTGLPVESPDGNDESARDLLQRLLGVSSAAAYTELTSARGASVRLDWLKESFSQYVTNDNPDYVHCAARAYLLYILGCTLFCDKSGTRVSVQYLYLLEDAPTVHLYAWGTAALAYMYRQLGLASRAGVKQLSGFITLLEAWIYEHFPTTRPMHNTEYKEGYPLAMRWASGSHGGAFVQGVQAYREWLDMLSVFDVVWDPYVDVRASFPRPEASFYHGCIRALDIVEPYHPDRVLRQLGFVQTIPANPLVPSVVRRGQTAGQYKVLWGVLGRYFETWDNHVLSERRRGLSVELPWDCSNEYLQWYTSVSHPQIQNPERRSTFTRPGDVDVTQPWEQVMIARGLLQPVLQRWNDNDETLTLHDVMPRVSDAYVALQGLSLEDMHQNAETSQQARRQRRGQLSRQSSCRQR